MDPLQQPFDNAYWLSQPPEVQALPSISDYDTRMARAYALAMKGFTIDIPIMGWLWDPYLVMQFRQQYGYTWVPSALQPAPAEAPGLSMPGVVAYDPNVMPAGAIKVSLNLADYPPFVVPVTAPVPAPVTDPVGFAMSGGVGPNGGALYYNVLTNAAYPDGFKYTSDPRGIFLKHITMSPFGSSPYWEKVG